MKKQEIYWIEPYDINGNSFSADIAYNWEDAHNSAMFYKAEADEQGYYQICIWNNRDDIDFGSQPDYSIDPEWMWKR